MRRGTYRTYLLTVLLGILAFNGVDGLALGLVLQNIKIDLHLTDTQLGLLSGIAFALFYSVMGVPIARWADRGNRIAIISLSTALWSLMVALCGFATSFVQFLAIRVGVAIGEAGCVPPAHSLIADYFSRTERPRAVGIYLLGGSLSVLIGYFAAGWLNELYGWRTMFRMVGLPGVGFAVLAWLTLEEPRKTRGPGGDASGPSSGLTTGAASARDVAQALWANTTFRHLGISYAVAAFFGFGILQWQPAYFIRSFGFETGELGTWFAAIYGLGGAAGTYLGGAWASRFAAKNERLQLKVMAAGYSSFGLFSALIYLSPNRYVAFIFVGITAVGGSTVAGPLFGTIQSLVPERMRATSVAIILMFSNLVGMGLGPLATGTMSDALRPWLGEESLRYALLVLSPGYLWAGWHLWRASRTVTIDLAGARGAGHDGMPEGGISGGAGVCAGPSEASCPHD